MGNDRYRRIVGIVGPDLRQGLELVVGGEAFAEFPVGADALFEGCIPEVSLGGKKDIQGTVLRCAELGGEAERAGDHDWTIIQPLSACHETRQPRDIIPSYSTVCRIALYRINNRNAILIGRRRPEHP